MDILLEMKKMMSWKNELFQNDFIQIASMYILHSGRRLLGFTVYTLHEAFIS